MVRDSSIQCTCGSMMLSAKLQVLRDPRSSALMHFRDDARTAERAADATGLIPHPLVRLLRPEDRLAVGQGVAHTSRPDGVQVFTREGEDVGQEKLRSAGPSGFAVANP
jgi:hypothetical protein